MKNETKIKATKKKEKQGICMLEENKKIDGILEQLNILEQLIGRMIHG